MALSCTNCQTQLPDDAAFCHKCGKPTAVQTEEKPNPRFCAKCGVLFREDALFCLACGASVTTDEKRWYEKIDQQREQELMEGAPYFTGRKEEYEVIDFEENKYAIKVRARRWAEYYFGVLMSAPEWFDNLWLLRLGTFEWSQPGAELRFLRTNKPNAMEALVTKTMVEWFTDNALIRGYYDHEGNFSPKVITYFELTWVKDGMPGALADLVQEGFRFKVDFSELDEKAKKDDELFPSPQPLRVEVAGATLNFTTNEGVLVVYVDCAYKGKTLEIRTFSESSVWTAYPDRKSEIRERASGTTVLCAAIFNHIPFVTNDLRYNQKVLTQMECTVSTTISADFQKRWEEKVTLYRDQVTELDWRGRKA